MGNKPKWWYIQDRKVGYGSKQVLCKYLQQGLECMWVGMKNIKEI